MAQADIDLFLFQARGKQAAQMGPAILAVNRLSMVDMLRAFEQLGATERDEFRKAAFDGIPAQGCGFSSTVREAQQVGIARIKYAFLVVTQKKLPNEIPGDLYETGQFKDACEFLKVSPTKNVWVTIIGGVCEDARLRKRGEEGSIVSPPTIMDVDAAYGQAGWDIGIKYGTGTFNSLPQLLTSRSKGFLLGKLGINAHGDPGEVSVNGVDFTMKGIEPILRLSNLTTFSTVFEFLDKVMSADASFLFQSCNAGNGPQGTDLLTRLSLQLRGRKIIGFSKLGFTAVSKDHQRRGGDKCIEPGARDTPYPLDPTPDNIRAGAPKDENEKYFKSGLWDDLGKMPWQAETSPHAKVALNGSITRGANL